MPQFKDQTGRTLKLDDIPQRIVSVVPSQTEFLYDIGLKDQLVGQTIFCVHPENEFKLAAKVGGTKKLQLQKIRSLKPDLIIANKEENEQSQILALEQEFPVWISDIYTLEDALKMMQNVGEICGKKEESTKIIQQISQTFLSLVKPLNRKKILYLIWREPYMAACSHTFINDMIFHSGFQNIMQEEGSRYPELSAQQIKEMKPDEIWLSSEPYPFRDVHVKELKTLLPGVKIRLVDGEMFSWYGSRLLKFPEFIRRTFM